MLRAVKMLAILPAKAAGQGCMQWCNANMLEIGQKCSILINVSARTTTKQYSPHADFKQFLNRLFKSKTGEKNNNKSII
jgi:hypothetical protein